MVSRSDCGKDCDVMIFLQSSRDIVYVLQLLSLRPDNFVSIYVVDHLQNYKIMEELVIDRRVRLFFIKNFSIRNPVLVGADFIRLRWLYFLHFSRLKDTDVYFFTNYFDYKTFFFIKKLSQFNNVTMLDHYMVTREKRDDVDLEGKLRKLLIWFVTGIECYFAGQNSVPTFELGGVPLKVESNVALDQNEIAAYRKQLEVELPAVVFFDTVDESSVFEDYEVQVSRIIKRIVAQGYHVYVKAHPRGKVDRFCYLKGVHVLSNDFPAELIDFSKFKFGITAISAAITCCNVKTISLLELIDFRNAGSKQDYRAYLSDLNNEILFPQSEKQLIEWIGFGENVH